MISRPLMILRRLGGRGGDEVFGEKLLSLESWGEELFATETSPSREILGRDPREVGSSCNKPLFPTDPFD